MKDVVEVYVYGEPNPLVGNIVCAKIRLLKKNRIKQVFKTIKKILPEKIRKI